MNTDIKGHILKIGCSDFLDSGCLVVNENEIVTYQISIPGSSNNNPLLFKFRFVTEENMKDESGNLIQYYTQTVKKDEHEKEYLDFAFVNMQGGSFVGNLKKITLGYISEHLINLRFRIHSIRSTFLFFYTFSLDVQNSTQNISQSK